MNRTRQHWPRRIGPQAPPQLQHDRGQGAERHPGPAIDPAHRIDVDAGPGHAAAARGKSASRSLAVRQSAKAIGAARDVVLGARLRWMIFTVGSMPGRIAPRLAGRKGAHRHSRTALRLYRQRTAQGHGVPGSATSFAFQHISPYFLPAVVHGRRDRRRAAVAVVATSAADREPAGRAAFAKTGIIMYLPTAAAVLPIALCPSARRFPPPSVVHSRPRVLQFCVVWRLAKRGNKWDLRCESSFGNCVHGLPPQLGAISVCERLA